MRSHTRGGPTQATVTDEWRPDSGCMAASTEADSRPDMGIGQILPYGVCWARATWPCCVIANGRQRAAKLSEEQLEPEPEPGSEPEPELEQCTIAVLLRHGPGWLNSPFLRRTLLVLPAAGQPSPFHLFA